MGCTTSMRISPDTKASASAAVSCESRALSELSDRVGVGHGDAARQLCWETWDEVVEFGAERSVGGTIAVGPTMSE